MCPRAFLPRTHLGITSYKYPYLFLSTFNSVRRALRSLCPPQRMIALLAFGLLSDQMLYQYGQQRTRERMSASGRMDVYLRILAIYVVGVHFLVYVDDGRQWA